MKTRIKFGLAIAGFAFAIMVIYISCRKADIFSSKSPQQTIEDKFFNSHRSNDPKENALVDYLKRLNSQHPFIEKTAKQMAIRVGIK